MINACFTTEGVRLYNNEVIEDLTPDEAINLANQLLAMACYLEEVKNSISKRNRHGINGDLFSLQEFKSMCRCGAITNCDGHGYFIDDTGKRCGQVTPSDFVSSDVKLADSINMVLWFNK